MRRAVVLSVGMTLAWIAGARATPLSVIDFETDKDMLRGEVVQVRGNASCLRDSLCLLSDPGVYPRVVFDPIALPREDRRRLLQCGGCRVVVTGTQPSSRKMLTELKAYSVDWAGPRRARAGPRHKTVPRDHGS